MKITKVEVFRLPTANSKQNSPIGCRIHTDVGICGDGEAGMAYGVGGSGAFGMVCDLAELIIGMDPLRTEFIWETMYKRTFWGQNGGPVVFSGIGSAKGVGMVGGRRFWNQATCSLTIQSGTQGQKRNDLVVARYSRTSAGIESIEPVVVKGTPSVDKPTDPKVGVNDLRLWRIPLDGINAGKPVALFEAVSPLATVGAAVAYATYDTGWYVAYPGDDIDVRARRIGDAVYRNGRLRGYTVTTSGRAITTLPPLYSPDVQTYFAGSGTDGNNVVQMDIEPDGKLYAKTMGGEVKGVVFSACYAVPERPHRL